MPVPLVLIPCSDGKVVRDHPGPADEPLPGMRPARLKLSEEVRGTEGLRDRRANSNGLLNPDAPLTLASDLYTGNLYSRLRVAWTCPAFQILIVSAGYGLLKPGEAISNYDLTMYDQLHDGRSVELFWEENETGRCLIDFVAKESCPQVWSLLSVPYQGVLRPFWDWAHGADVEARSVKAWSAGPGQAYKRGEWLETMAEMSDGTDELLRPSSELPGIPGFTFTYELCL